VPGFASTSPRRPSAGASANSTADIGILSAGNYGEAFTVLPYRADELVLIVPKEHALARRRKVSFCEALAHEFVGAHPDSAMNNQLHKAAADLGLPLRLRIQVSGYDAMSLMVAAGMGVAVLPRQSARLYLPGLGIRAVTLDEPWVRRQLVLCVRSLEALSPAARSLVEHLGKRGSDSSRRGSENQGG